jgi:outer membrane immunogenic protein
VEKTLDLLRRSARMRIIVVTSGARSDEQGSGGYRMTTARSQSLRRPAMLAATVAITAAIVGLLTAPAVAQEPPPGYYPPPDYYPLPWQGSYLGFHLGWGNADAGDGFVGGLQIGYNWQSGRLVYGLEADVTWSDISDSETFRVCAGPGACVSTRVESSIDWLATVRGRVGYIVQPGFLAYATAGFGFVSASASASLNVPGFDIGSLHADETDTSFVWGFGVESRISPTTLVRIEYLAFNDDADLNVLRAGVSFKLGNWGG